MEVYNETVVDLLDVEKGYLQLRESRSGRVYVENVNEELVNTGTEVYASKVNKEDLAGTDGWVPVCSGVIAVVICGTDVCSIVLSSIKCHVDIGFHW